MKYILFFTIFLLVGCGPKAAMTSEDEINGPWEYTDPLEFSLDIEDTQGVYDLVLAINYSAEFSYQNIYVNIETLYPDGTVVKDVVSLNIMDNGGMFLGDCDSKKCTTDIVLQPSFRFKDSGVHQFKIYQHSRTPQLEGVYGGVLKLFEKK